MLAKIRLTTLCSYLLGALLIWAMIGCGGSGGGNAGGGQVSMKIAWPAPSRYIPNYAQSIVFSLYAIGDESNARTMAVNRPDTLPLVQTVTFDGPITSGFYTITGQAMTGMNGSGVRVASALNIVFVEAEGTTTVAMTLGTTLASIELLNVPLTLGPGESDQLLVRVLDKDDNQILLPDGALTWSLLFGGQSVTLDQAGVVTAIAPGNARVRVSEVGAGLYSEGDIVSGLYSGSKEHFKPSALSGVRTDFNSAKRMATSK